MSNLLTVSRMNSKAMSRKGTTPLILEVKVNSETAPYLVSSSAAFQWVEDPFEGDVVRAAVRQTTPGEMFHEVMRNVVHRGRVDEWGNIHPFTLNGVLSAIQHVESYGMGQTELLMAPITTKGPPKKGTSKKATSKEEGPKTWRPDWATPDHLGCPIRPAGWLPEGCAVVVPVDREFVGLLVHLGPKHVAAVVHNAARSMGVAIGG